MANVSVYNIEGKEVGSIELNDAVFGVEVNEHNVCGETAGSLHYISGITPERAKQVLNIDKGGGNPPLTYFIGVW